ncbi:hypothetical protein KKE92_03445 [Candidatus Micrarchaeota archaeon]|nr:hypothetical protein [Candidatus Micrarchaeota archaeon]MBU1681207.1 hypothetical protein [Candidatus Micrarchaeota archaeon]
MKHISKDKGKAKPTMIIEDPLNQGSQTENPLSRRRILLEQISYRQIVDYAIEVMEKEGITRRIQLHKHDPLLYEALRRKGADCELGFEDNAGRK